VKVNVPYLVLAVIAFSIVFWCVYQVLSAPESVLTLMGMGLKMLVVGKI